MFDLHRSRPHLLKGMLLMGVLAVGVAFGIATHRSTVNAQEMQSQVFGVNAGGHGPANIEVLAFMPQSLQVHRGDTVTWFNTGFHNIHFEDQPSPLVVAPEVNGQPLPQINPAVAFPTITSDSAYTGGDVNSGLPVDPAAPPFFSLVMDVEPGTYRYMCDVHPGMAGVITVVADDVAIPGITEVFNEAASEYAAHVGAARGELAAILANMGDTSSDGLMIQTGSGESTPSTINQFFPFAATVKAGESVTWSIPANGVEPHTVAWPAVYGQDVAPIPVDNAPPILGLGPSIAPMTASGSSVGQGDAFQSGLFMPGQSFTLTFTEPGLYPYACTIHPGMSGTIQVLTAE